MKHAKDIKLQQGKTYTIEIPEEHTCTITLPYDRTYLVLQEQNQTNTGKLSKDDDDDDYTYTMKPVKVLNFPDRSSVCSHKDHTDGMGHTEKEENDNFRTYSFGINRRYYSFNCFPYAIVLRELLRNNLRILLALLPVFFVAITGA